MGSFPSTKKSCRRIARQEGGGRGREGGRGEDGGAVQGQRCCAFGGHWTESLGQASRSPPSLPPSIPPSLPPSLPISDPSLPPTLPPSLPPYRGIGINPTPPTALAMWGPYVGTMFFLMQELKNILLTLLLPPSLPPPLPHLQRHGHQSYSSQRFSNVGSLRRDAPLPHLWHEGARAAEAFFVRSAEEEEAGKEGYGGREGGRGVLFAPLE